MFSKTPYHTLFYNNLSKHCLAFTASFILFSFSCSAWSFTTESVTDDDIEIEDYAYAIPYLYYAQSTELIVGALFISEGIWQPQINVSATAYTSANGSNGVWIKMEDIKITNRIGMNIEGFTQYWTNLDIYSNDAGRDSSIDDFTRNRGRESSWDLSTFFVLPIGSVKDNAIHNYKLDKYGILDDKTASGGKKWNPLTSGRTIITTGLDYNKIEFDNEQPSGIYQKSLAAYLKLEYDNTDYFRNPTYGSRQIITYKRDWGGEQSDVPWTTIELDLSKYTKIATSKWNRQQLIAFNAWFKNTPTWDQKENGLYQRPPISQRAGLGGLDRMRAYSSQRFNDQAAVYYSVEYRVTPKKNLLASLGALSSIVKVKWLQFVMFAEVGQVNNNLDIKELHTDMKWDVGVGVRGLVNGIVVRLDTAVSEEGGAFTVFIGQTF